MRNYNAILRKGNERFYENIYDLYVLNTSVPTWIDYLIVFDAPLQGTIILYKESQKQSKLK